jgi:hypothetical protein
MRAGVGHLSQEWFMRRNSIHAFGAAALAICVAACDSGTTGTGSLGAGNAQLKVVHAAQAIGPVEVRIAGSPVISGLSYGHSSGLTNVPAGTQELTFVAGGVTVARVNATLNANRLNAVAFNGDTAQVTPVTPDTGIAATNRANIRLINVAGVSTAPPTRVQVLLNFPDVSQDSVAKLGLDTSVPSHGPLMYFNPGHFKFRIVPDGGTTVLASVEFDVAGGEKKAVVVEREASGAYLVKVVTEP